MGVLAKALSKELPALVRSEFLDALFKDYPKCAEAAALYAGAQAPARKPLDPADIVRDATLRQQSAATASSSPSSLP